MNRSTRLDAHRPGVCPCGRSRDTEEQEQGKRVAQWGRRQFGVPGKLIVAEARNFPELARFYYENVISRGRALVGHALKRGMESGEFRPMDVETTIDVVIAPILMLLIWRYSMNCCQGSESDPRLYLKIHMDLLRHGLRRPEKESQV